MNFAGKIHPISSGNAFTMGLQSTRYYLYYCGYCYAPYTMAGEGISS